MKQVLISAILIFTVYLTGCTVNQAESRPGIIGDDIGANAAKNPVLVELFTSEGCENCPAADRTLKFLEDQQIVHGADVIGLAFHVDYWDRLGWKDRFSSSEYTRRQEAYARHFGIDSTFTPQMVVDGGFQFIGSDMDKAMRSITRSATSQKGSVSAVLSDGKFRIDIKGLGEHAKATVFLAVAEDNLSTSVRGGENIGRNLQHSAVVRELMTIGRIDKAQAEFSAEIEPRVVADWNASNIKYVVFVQENDSRRILAVGRTRPGK